MISGTRERRNGDRPGVVTATAKSSNQTSLRPETRLGPAPARYLIRHFLHSQRRHIDVSLKARKRATANRHSSSSVRPTAGPAGAPESNERGGGCAAPPPAARTSLWLYPIFDHCQ